MSFKFGTFNVDNTLNFGFNSGNNGIKLGDKALAKQNESPVKQAIRTVGNVIESGSDILTTPACCVKDMQNNRFSYTLILVIILSTAAPLYCVVRFHNPRRRDDTSTSKLIQLATVLKNTDPTQLKQQNRRIISSIEDLNVWHGIRRTNRRPKRFVITELSDSLFFILYSVAKMHETLYQ